MRLTVSARRFVACLAAIQALGCHRGAEQTASLDSEIVKITGPTMGTRYSVRIVSGDSLDPPALKELIDERLALVNRRFSTYDSDSELSRFNAQGSSDWFPVSAATVEVVTAALELANETGGAYDPTVGPLVNLWGFGPGKRRTTPPTDDEIRAAADSVGHSSVDVRIEPPAVRKRIPELQLDLSSIAKGHGVDAVAGLLVDRGCTDFMVEIGGEVRARGRKPGGKPWRIGVEKADQPIKPFAGRRLQRIVELVDAAMATSGDYRNFFEHEGRRYSHTIDPTTGRPVGHALATVTVIAEDCRAADGLATALLVLGPKDGYDWAVERQIAAMFVSRQAGDDSLVERVTPEWEVVAANPQSKAVGQE